MKVADMIFCLVQRRFYTRFCFKRSNYIKLSTHIFFYSFAKPLQVTKNMVLRDRRSVCQFVCQSVYLPLCRCVYWIIRWSREIGEENYNMPTEMCEIFQKKSLNHRVNITLFQYIFGKKIMFRKQFPHPLPENFNNEAQNPLS